MDRKVLHRISYGLYVVCSKNGDRYNGQIANAIIQVSAEPPTIAICINKNNLTHEFIENSGIFTISILEEEAPMGLIGQFGFRSGRDTDKFRNVEYQQGMTGVPVILTNTVGFIEAEVVGSADVGTHTIFIGRVIDGEIISDGNVMTYEYYHRVKGGRSPKNAPTFDKDIDGIEENHKEMSNMDNMDRYKCRICGYIYDPENGDPDGGVAPGTAFADVPDDWVCPVCGAGKDDFEMEA